MNKKIAGLEDQSKELVAKIIKLKTSLQQLQEYKGEINKNLQGIKRALARIPNRKNPKNENEIKVQQLTEKIQTRTERIEVLLTNGPSDKVGSGGYYKIKFRRIFNAYGLFEAESETVSLSVKFKGRLYEVMNELIKKYVEDSKTDVPIEFRGYIKRKELEKKVFGEYKGRNRLNANITRIRSILIENGLTDPSFIKSMNEFVRLNINSDDVTMSTAYTK